MNKLTIGTTANETAIATVPNSGEFALAAENAGINPSARAGDVRIEYTVIAATTTIPLSNPAHAPALVVFLEYRPQK